jgi:hypothetical protein
MFHRHRDAHGAKSTFSPGPYQVGASDWLALGHGPGNDPPLEGGYVFFHHQVLDACEVGRQRFQPNTLQAELGSLCQWRSRNGDQRSCLPIL